MAGEDDLVGFARRGGQPEVDGCENPHPSKTGFHPNDPNPALAGDPGLGGAPAGQRASRRDEGGRDCVKDWNENRACERNSMALRSPAAAGAVGIPTRGEIGKTPIKRRSPSAAEALESCGSTDGLKAVPFGKPDLIGASLAKNERRIAKSNPYSHFLLCHLNPIRARIGWPRVATGVRPMSY